MHVLRFHRKRDQDGAYEYSLDDIRREASAAIEAGATEVHIVGGLHPWLPFEYYTDMMRAIHEVAPSSTSRRSPPSRSSIWPVSPSEVVMGMKGSSPF